MKYTLCNGLIILAVVGVISGCASTPLHSDNVTIKEKGPISKKCTLKGPVSAADSSRNMSTPSQHSSLKTEEFDDLKHQALNLGANTVLLSTSSGMSDMKHRAAKSQHSEIATHVYSGDAYWCPAS
jgi:Domain of unknown function (DUF4156)